MAKFKKGELVQLISNAKFANGVEVPKSVIKSKIYVREVKEDNKYTISTVPRGPITGIVEEEMLKEYEEIEPGFEPYVVRIMIDNLTTYSGPGVSYKPIKSLGKGKLYTIIGEQEGFGRLKDGRGWVDLDCVKKF